MDSAHLYVALRHQIVIHFTPMAKSKQALLLNSEYKYPLEYLDINLLLETSFALRNGILWKSLIQVIYINISKLIFQQLIFQQLFNPTANLSTANLSTANLSTANLITVNFSKANFATAFKQGSRNFNPKLWQLGTKNSKF